MEQMSLRFLSLSLEIIHTDKGTFKKRIIGKSGGNLLTFDNEKIRMSDIRDIYR